MLKLSQGSLKALELLQSGLNYAYEMKEKGFKVNGSHLTALVNAKLVVSTNSQLTCGNCGSKRKVNHYELTEMGKTFSPNGE